MAIHPPPPPSYDIGIGCWPCLQGTCELKRLKWRHVYMYMYIVIRYLSKVQIKGRITLCIVTYQLYDCVHVHMYRKYIRCSIKYYHHGFDNYLFDLNAIYAQKAETAFGYLQSNLGYSLFFLYLFTLINTFSYRHSIRDDII